MYTYLIDSVYLPKKRINEYFKNKPFKSSNINEKNLTFLYLDYLKISDKKYWNFYSKIKNLIGEDKAKFTDKNNLNNFIQKRFTMDTYTYSVGKSLESYQNIFKNDKIYILKPAKGWGGYGIKIVKYYEELVKYFKEDVKKIDLRKVKEPSNWVIQEYLVDPMLYINRKFHLRIYFLVLENKIYYFTRYLIITATKEYKKTDFGNKAIHDSHYEKDSIRNKIFPEDFPEKKYIDKIEKDINLLFKYIKKNLKLPMKCFPENDHCYEIFAADIMLTKDGSLKVLEFNHNVGYPETMDKRYPLFENQLDIVLNYYGLIDKESMSKENYFKAV